MSIHSHTILPQVMEQTLTPTTHITTRLLCKCPTLGITLQEVQVDTLHTEGEMADTALLLLLVLAPLVLVQQVMGLIKLKATPTIRTTRLLTVGMVHQLHHP
jgi:hypothetical protein